MRICKKKAIWKLAVITLEAHYFNRERPSKRTCSEASVCDGL
jgi:hypothetical protein